MMFRAPYHLEAFLWFGQALAMDLLLFHFTLLPLRALRSAAALVWQAAVAAACACRPKARAAAAPRLPLSRASLYDLLKVAILLAATGVLGMVEVSRVYHYIRGEAVIKLYVIFNILEVVDRLCSSLGSDWLDTLHRTVRASPDLPAVPSLLAAAAAAVARTVTFRGGGGNKEADAATWRQVAGLARLVALAGVVVVYVTFHAGVMFVQIVCLTVAVNSKSTSLLTLLISNNFVELKGSVFKRFELENLFQVSCADAVERTQLAAYMTLILLQEGATPALLTSMATIWMAEVGVDWVKHAFVVKFNRLPPDAYTKFTAILAHDTVVVRSRMAASMDPTHAGVRRLGLGALPLTTVVLRMVLTKVHPSWYPRPATLSGAAALLLIAACLVAAKLLLATLLLARSAAIIAAQRAAAQAAPFTSPARRTRTVSRQVSQRPGGATVELGGSGALASAPVPAPPGDGDAAPAPPAATIVLPPFASPLSPQPEAPARYTSHLRSAEVAAALAAAEGDHRVAASSSSFDSLLASAPE